MYLRDHRPCTCVSHGYWCGFRSGKVGLIGNCATHTVYYCKENIGEPIKDQCDAGGEGLCFEDARGDMCGRPDGFEI